MGQTQIEIRATPHPGQRAIHDCPARFRVADCGRRFGKTQLGVLECVDAALAGGLAWWVAPTYKVSEAGWEPLARLCRRLPAARISESEKSVACPTGGKIESRTGEDYTKLVGKGLNFVVLDECATMKQQVWFESLRPALSDKLGRALFIGTPKGRNWFWELFQRGISGRPGWASFTFPTSANPYIAASEIEDARRDLPELIFRQEYLAEFIDDQGGVFRRVQECATATRLERPQDGRTYIAGVDVAASVDYTVVAVLDAESRQMVAMDRFNRVDYTVLEDRLMALYRRFRMAAMVIEVNSIGQPVLDRLAFSGINVVPFMTTSATKQLAIMALQSAFEHLDIRIIDDPVLIGELLSFESKRTAAGNFSYSAPEGLHDDCVMALALAWQGIAGGGSADVFTFDDRVRVSPV